MINVIVFGRQWARDQWLSDYGKSWAKKVFISECERPVYPNKKFIQRISGILWPLTFIFSKIHSFLFIGDNLFQVHYTGVIQLSEDLDLSNSRYRKTFLLILQPNLLQGNQFTCSKQKNYTFCSNTFLFCSFSFSTCIEIPQNILGFPSKSWGTNTLLQL